MTNILVRNFSISLDGYGAGPSQDVEHPLGIGGNLLHEWIFATRSGRQMIGADGGTEDIDDASSRRAIRALAPRSWVGTCSAPTWSVGRERMVRLVGEEPPFHHSVFVLTHYPQPSIEMRGGRRFVSSTAESRRRSRQRSTPRVNVMFSSRRRINDSAIPSSGSSTICVSRWCPSCSAAANDCSRISDPALQTTNASSTSVRHPSLTSAFSDPSESPSMPLPVKELTTPAERTGSSRFAHSRVPHEHLEH